MLKTKFICIIGLVGLFLLAGCGNSSGAEKESNYPSGNIEYLVAAGAGGGTDNFARQVQPMMEENLDTTINVINLPSASGAQAHKRTANSAAEGLTIDFASSTYITSLAAGQNPTGLDKLTPAAMVSYSETVRWSKHPEKFGKGVPEGIAAPEAANNAAAMGALVPLFALGIPGSGTTAIILGAFVMHGLQPGPTFMTNNNDLIYAVFVGLLIVNILILLFSKPFIRLFSKLLNVPYAALGPIIIICCVVGTFSVRNSMFDVWLMLGFGVLGYFLEKIDFPLVAIILGLVLGPIAESELRRSLAMSQGDFSIFFTRPISATLISVAIVLVTFAIITPILKKRKTQKS